MSGRGRGRINRTAPTRDEEGNMAPEQFKPWREVVEGGISATTLRSYRHYYKVHVELGFAKEGEAPTVAGLINHLTLKDSGLTRGMGYVLVNAVKLELRVHNVPISDEEKARIQIAVKHLDVSADTRLRGGIDCEMLNQLLEFVNKMRFRKSYKKSGEYVGSAIFALVLTWMTGLRRVQMESLCKRNFIEDEEGKLWVYIEKIHDPSAGNRAAARYVIIPVQIPDIKNGQSYYDTLCTRLGNLQDEDLVCPGYGDLDLNKLIHDAAKACNWDKELKFDGVHCLRHGVVAHVREVSGFMAAAIQAGHSLPVVGTEVTEGYSNSNSDKIDIMRGVNREEMERKTVENKAAIVNATVALKLAKKKQKIEIKNSQVEDSNIKISRHKVSKSQSSNSKAKSSKRKTPLKKRTSPMKRVVQPARKGKRN